MSQASDLLAAGFVQMSTVHFPSTITKGGVPAKCVSTEVMKLKQQMDAGYELDFDCAVELLTTDFEDLGIALHDKVVMDDQPFEVIAVRPDKTDPCVRLGLKNIKGGL
jgi:hypothetical protein